MISRTESGFSVWADSAALPPRPTSCAEAENPPPFFVTEPALTTENSRNVMETLMIMLPSLKLDSALVTNSFCVTTCPRFV